MIKDKIKLFTYYDFEFKRNFVLNELNRVLDKKVSELTTNDLKSTSLKDKVKLIDSLITDEEDKFLFNTYMDLHESLELIENRTIPFENLYIPKAEYYHYYRKLKKIDLYPAFKYDENGVVSVFKNIALSDKNMLLSYIEIYETKLVELKKFYKKKALQLK